MADFNWKLEKLGIQIINDYYINWKIAQIEKMFNNFPSNLDWKGGGLSP